MSDVAELKVTEDSFLGFVFTNVSTILIYSKSYISGYTIYVPKYHRYMFIYG